MFKNSVLRTNVNTKEWLKATGIRAVKTFAETFVSMVTVGQAFNQVSWQNVLSVSGVACVLSIMVSIAGIQEVVAQDESEE